MHGNSVGYVPEGILQLMRRKQGMVVFVFTLVFLCIACNPLHEQAASETRKHYYLSDQAAFSVPSGIYNQSFEIELTPLFIDGQIRYTLDCSVPTCESILYQQPIKIDFDDYDDVTGTSASIVRYSVFDSSGMAKSKVYTATYILVKDKNRFDLPVISLVTDNDNLYSSDKGIFVAGDNNNMFVTGRASEREVHFEYIDDQSGQLVLSQNSGMRLMGQASRGMTHKSLRIFARKQYDREGKFKFVLFPDNDHKYGGLITKFDSLILRAGSSSTYNSIINTQFVYRFAQKEESLDTGHYSPAVVFLNGKYYGYMAVLEDYSPDFFALRYGIPKDGISTLNGGPDINADGFWQLDDGPEPEYEEFLAALQYVASNDMADPVCYAQACEYFDIDNYIAYMAFECYMDNWDWPRNNIRVWRFYRNGYKPCEAGAWDGRWRFVLKDLDSGLGWFYESKKSDPEIDYYAVGLRDRDFTLIPEMFESLLNSDVFKEKFINKTCDLLGTVLDPKSLTEQLNITEMEVGREVGHMLEWYKNDTAELAYPGDSGQWDSCVQLMRDFIKERPEAVYNSISARYEGAKPAMLTVRINGGGMVRINTLNVRDGFENIYFTGVPIPFEAFSGEGYEIECIEEEGDAIIADGKIILSGDTVLTVSYASAPQDIDASLQGNALYDARLYGACLINGKLYEKDLFNIINGDYRLIRARAREVFGDSPLAISYIDSIPEDDYISVREIGKAINANRYSIKALDAYVYSYSAQ